VVEEVYSECNKLKDILATLADLTADCKHFQELEAQNRATVLNFLNKIQKIMFKCFFLM